MTLTTEQRHDLWAELMRELSRQRASISLTKPELRAAVDAVDAWVEANAASYNSAIPQPARGALSAQQKAQLLMYVVTKRFEG